MSLRSPLGKALGKGSAKDGFSHWWAQRVTAIALVPLTLWFVFSVLGLPDHGYSTVRSWLGAGLTPILLLLLVGALSYHSALGVQVVIEDYIHSKPAKVAALLGSSFAHFFVAAACAFALLKVAFA